MKHLWFMIRAFVLFLVCISSSTYAKASDLSTGRNFVQADTVVSSQTQFSCKPAVLVVILSDARQQWKRDTVRQSWAGAIKRLEETGKLTKGSLRYMFVVGRLHTVISPSNTAEAKQHEDLVVADQSDYDYELYTSKLLWTLRWAANNCQFDVLLKVDDVDFVNPIMLMKRWFPSVSKKDIFRGAVIRNSKSFHDEDHPWYMPADYYPKDTYPPYPDGSFALSKNMCARVIDLLSGSIEKMYYADVAVAMALEGVVTVFDDRVFISKNRPSASECEGAVVIGVTAEKMLKLGKNILSSVDGKVC